MLKQNSSFCLFLSIFIILKINGISSSDKLTESRIINGTAANLDATKHQVSIRSREDEDTKFGSGHKCGGSLISNNVVLTAAHCFVRPDFKYYPDKDFVVVMGNVNRLRNNSNTLRFDILKSVKGSFNEYLDEDIALIILNGTVPYNHPTVRPIVLSDGPLKNNTLCQATGWGLTEKNNLSTILKTVDLPIIDYNDCRHKTEYESTVRPGMLCAGYLEGARDTCSADSGGPLVCRGIQAGIVSWGSGCGRALNPGVYTNVTYYKDWILQQVSKQNASLPKFAPVPDGVVRQSYSLVLISFMFILNFV